MSSISGRLHWNWINLHFKLNIFRKMVSKVKKIPYCYVHLSFQIKNILVKNIISVNDSSHITLVGNNLNNLLVKISKDNLLTYMIRLNWLFTQWSPLGRNKLFHNPTFLVKQDQNAMVTNGTELCIPWPLSECRSLECVEILTPTTRSVWLSYGPLGLIILPLSLSSSPVHYGNCH